VCFTHTHVSTQISVRTCTRTRSHSRTRTDTLVHVLVSKQCGVWEVAEMKIYRKFGVSKVKCV